MIFSSFTASIGSVISNIALFKLIKFSFKEEFNRLKTEKPILFIKHITRLDMKKKINHYLLYAFAGIVLASPLPDEIGVIMLSGLSHIKPLKLAAISFVLHFIGIYAIFLIS